MGKDFSTALRPAIVLTIAFALLLGILYPLAITGIAQALFPRQANGSLVRNAAGEAIGSALIGQNFAAPGYFHPRPSAAGKDGYDGTASSGSNLGPTSQALADRVRTDLAALPPSPEGSVPADLVTTSASVLDPDISPEAAFFQVDRVAVARGVSAAALQQLIRANIDRPMIPFLGDAHVNVLALNRQLDTLGSKPTR